MSPPKIILIAAMARNRVIGSHNHIPWHIPEEMAHFKATTMGHALVMGRKTWESIGHPLSGRTNIIISRNHNYQAAGCLTALTIGAGITLAQRNHQTIFIIGGGEIYRQAMEHASAILISKLHRDVEGDVLFPAIDHRHFQLQTEQTIYGSERFTLQQFIRRPQP